MRWSVVVSSPKGEAGAQWGDTWFAADVVDALSRAGEHARVVFRGGASSEKRDKDDVVVVLRGLRRVDPRPGGSTWMLWVISHPELVEAEEVSEYHAVFAASAGWDGGFGVPVTPLLQATNPHRFTPSAARPDSGDPLLFVGSTRGEFRPVVRAALAGGLALRVYGVGWDRYLPPEQIAGEFIPNELLPAAYASAGIVLNDHWADMARDGFLSNRLFDAGACAARILTDEAVGLADVFGDGLRTYRDADEVAGFLLEGPEAWPDRTERLDLAARIAREHSFDSRAAVLIDRARELRGVRS